MTFSKKNFIDKNRNSFIEHLEALGVYFLITLLLALSPPGVGTLIFFFKLVGLIFSFFLICYSVWEEKLKALRALVIIAIGYCALFLPIVIDSKSCIVTLGLHIVLILLIVDFKGLEKTAFFTTLVFYLVLTQIKCFPLSPLGEFSFQKVLAFIAVIFFTWKTRQLLNKRSLLLSSLYELGRADFRRKLLFNEIFYNASKYYEETLKRPINLAVSLESQLYKRNFIASSDLCEKLLDSLRTDAKYLRPYFILSPKKVNSENFFSKIVDLLTAFDIHVGLKKIDSTTIYADEDSLLKVFWLVAEKFLMLGKRKSIDIIARESLISYFYGDEFLKTVPAFDILISHEDNYDLPDNTTEKKVDLQENLHEPNDIEEIVLAHYGVYQCYTSNDQFAFRLTIPISVKDIRPSTLDLSPPTHFSYSYPQAQELEANFISKLIGSYPEVDIKGIENALEVIKKFHYHQTRKTGEPYYMHPIRVAGFVLQLSEVEESEVYSSFKKNIDSMVVAALLHDVLEDTSFNEIAMSRLFGHTVTTYVKEVTKINYQGRSWLVANDKAFSKLIEAKPRSICIKLADRLDNLITIDGHPSEKKRKDVAQETLNFFIKPAEILNFQAMKEDLLGASYFILKHGKVEGYKFIHKV